MTRLTEWLERQKTDRVLLGAKIFAAMLLFAGFLELREQSMLAAARLDAVRAEARSMARLGTDTDWQSRAERVRGNLQHWQETVWEASTPGVAAARIQSVLETLSRQAGLGNVNARVDPEPITPAGNAQAVLRFDVNLRGHAADIVRLISELALYSPRLVVTDASAILNEARSSLRLSGLAPFRERASGDGDATS
mgnify:CR=1 FL=1